MFMRFHRKEKGIGLLELMLSLAIIAVLLIMVTRYYQSTRRSSQMNQMVQTMNGIIAAVDAWRAGQTGVTNAPTMADLTSGGYLSKAASQQFWGGTITVGGTFSAVKITFGGLDEQVGTQLCARLSSLKPECGGTTLTVTLGS